MTAALRLDPSTGVLRGLRAGVLTIPTVGTAVLGHAAVDGCGSVFAVLVAAAVCWPAAVALLGRCRRLPALVAWVVGAQLMSHVVLAALCGEGAVAQHVLSEMTPAMLGAHAAAALVTGAFLARADAGLWAAGALLRAVGRLLRRGYAPPPVVVPPCLPSAPLRDCPRLPWVLLTQPTRRGPPVQAALAS